MIDVSNEERDPVADYETIVRELSLFNPELLDRKQLVVASKVDVLADDSRLSGLKEMCGQRNLPFLGISSVSGRGIKEMIGMIANLLET
jgi:GTP-binding protein